MLGDKKALELAEKKIYELEHEARITRDRHSQEIEHLKAMNAVKVEEARNEIRKELTKACIEADLKMTEAKAKLETYEKFDVKNDRKQLEEMLTKTLDGVISALKVQPNITVKK